MGRKNKGSNAERELAHMFHKHEWGVLRAAGSGSTTMPAPDILAGNRGKYLAIECKSTKDTKKYFPKEELEQLRLFAKNFGAEPWIGVRFDFLKWFFVHVDDIKKGKGKLYVITVDHARKKGKSFEELIGLFEQERLI
ncbi:MAG: Holliday junction resolvase [Nanoarchaeota archaeon]|nr:Holliday junction resolvase [Nanoarchaeota archaeon]MCG2718972.1 Holliday junction resolvase [Nanoarchaeota archaeon]